MEDKDMKKLEQSPAAGRITESLRRLGQEDRSTLPPEGFDALWAKVEEAPSRRRGISPWWLVAACLSGLLMGWGIPWGNGREDVVLAVADTIRLIERQVDTVYFERPLPVKRQQAKMASATVASGARLADSVASSVPSAQLPARNERRIEAASVALPLPDKGEAKGRNLVEENFPFHLLVEM